MIIFFLYFNHLLPLRLRIELISFRRWADSLINGPSLSVGILFFFLISWTKVIPKFDKFFCSSIFYSMMIVLFSLTPKLKGLSASSFNSLLSSILLLIFFCISELSVFFWVFLMLLLSILAIFLAFINGFLTGFFIWI